MTRTITDRTNVLCDRFRVGEGPDDFRAVSSSRWEAR